jgi:hypothetical protein
MTRKYNSLQSNKVAINRELDTSSYDTIKTVADNLPAIITASQAIDDNIAYSKEWATNPIGQLVSIEAGGNGIDQYSALHNSQQVLSNTANNQEAIDSINNTKFITPISNNAHFISRLGSGFNTNGTYANLAITDLNEVNTNMEGVVDSTTLANHPSNFSGLGLFSNKVLLNVAGTGTGYVTQGITAVGIDSPQKWIRHKNNGVFTDWKEVINKSFLAVENFTELALYLADDTIPVGSIITVKDNNNYTYEKLQGVATDNNNSIITENRGTTSSLQHYATVTGASTLLPDYAVKGDFFKDIGTNTNEHILTLYDGQLPVNGLYNGMIVRFIANVSGDGFDFSTVDISELLNKVQGTNVITITTTDYFPSGENQIKAGQFIELIYDNTGYFVIKNSAKYITYDGYSSNLISTNTKDAIDEVNTKVNNIESKSLTVSGNSHTLEVNKTYLIIASFISQNGGTGTTVVEGFKLKDENNNILYSEPNVTINSPDGNFAITKTVVHTATGTGFIKAEMDNTNALTLTIVYLGES